MNEAELRERVKQLEGALEVSREARRRRSIPHEQMRRTRHAIVGKCHAITFEPRGPSDPHIAVVLWVEDDGFWYEISSYSSHWQPEFSRLMEQATTALLAAAPDPSGFGRTGPFLTAGEIYKDQK